MKAAQKYLNDLECFVSVKIDLLAISGRREIHAYDQNGIDYHGVGYGLKEAIDDLLQDKEVSK